MTGGEQEGGGGKKNKKREQSRPPPALAVAPSGTRLRGRGGVHRGGRRSPGKHSES